MMDGHCQHEELFPAGRLAVCQHQGHKDKNKSEHCPREEGPCVITPTWRCRH